MAKSLNNIVMHGASGKLGNQIVFRQGKGGQTIIAVKPSGVKNFSPTQEAHQEAFRHAIAYAKSAKDEVIYITKAQGTVFTPFNAAVADWFNKPQVLEIDASNWTGEAGEIIRIKAQDDTMVAQVRVVIHATSGTTLETGNAVQADGLWWQYTTQVPTSGDPNTHITVTAQDLPGNTHEMSWAN